MNTTQILIEEIKNWKLEAKLENNDRYFYHTSLVDQILDGSKCYVIGRKGTGKTAISEYLVKKRESDTFSKKLTFKNFPFNDLYKLTNESYSAPNQYITFWKYLIYSSIAQLMAKNENINPEIRRKLEKIFSTEPSRSLSRTVKKLISGDIDFKVLGSGFKFGAVSKCEENNNPWIERVEALEDLLAEHIDNSKYLIIFDELDEDYKDILEITKYKKYTDLLTSLFKAVQDIKSIFPSNDYKIFPVIFLRDDIYDILMDPDKTKWSDLIIEIEWDIYNIKEMLAFRMSRAIKERGTPLPFNIVWNDFFEKRPVGYGTRQTKKMSIFDYITRSTHIRPRDYIRFLQVCAKNTKPNQHYKISPKKVVKADTAFSNYFRSELEDEIHGALQDVNEILNIISEVRKQTFKYEEFLEIYNKKFKEGAITTKNPEFILKVLFNFSVIGNQPTQKNIQVFRYQHRDARFSLKDPACVHRGLFKSLQII